jgi:WD40 repeat protein
LGISLLAFLALIVAGCSENKLGAYLRLEGVELMESIAGDKAYTKAVSDPRGMIVFAMSKDTQEIDIFKDGLKVNSIGGLGFERTNFQRLSDIGVDTDGGLLALDSARKLLRKFTPDGMYVSEISFSSLNQPELFCVASDGNLFLYDAAPAEVICFSALDNTEMYRFGRFELQTPVSIACNNDILYAYNPAQNLTYAFYLLGQYRETLDGQAVFDMFNNPLTEAGIANATGSMRPGLMSVNSSTLTVLNNNLIQLFHLIHARGNDETQ